MKRLFSVVGLACSSLFLHACGTGSATPPPPPPVATHLSVTSASPTVTTGTSFNITVSALDASGGVVASYSGTVHFTSSDAQAVLPANSTLTNGTGTFPVTLKTAGSQTIAVSDTTNPSIFGSSNTISVSPPAKATHFSVTAPGSVAAGTALNIAVTALDASNNAVTTYSGTVHFTSTDGQAVLPPNQTLTNGTGRFSVTLKTVGNESITATDVAAASITGTSSLVNVLAPSPLVITSGAPPNGTVGQAYGGSFSVVVDHCRATFSGWRLAASGGTGTYHWSWSAAPGSSLPPGLAVTVESFTCGGSTRCCVTVSSPPLIGGRPTVAGTYQVIVTVTDSASPSAQTSAPYTIVILSTSAAASDTAQTSSLRPQHTRYKLIDLGTLGGPSSYLNAFVDGFFPRANGPFFSGAQLLNRRGVLAGWSDTSTPDLFPSFCFNPDCFVSHSFRWQEGAITDLGTLAAGWSSATTGINDVGQVVGFSENGLIDPLISFPEVRAVLWENGQIFDLGTQGGNQSAALAVNNQGQIAGLALNAISDPFSIYDFLLYSSSNGTQTRAVLWDKEEGMHDLGTLGGPDAYAQFINERGQVAGWSYTNSTPNATGLPTFHPFLWEKGKGMRDLGTLGGTVAQAVNGLNQRGQVAGSTTLVGDATHHPFLWDGEKLIDLGTLGGDNGEADWLNDAGEVVGTAAIHSSCPGGQSGHAFLWSNGVMKDLGTTHVLPFSEAVFINARTQIVGYSSSCDFSVNEAFLWEDDSIVDLNTLISTHSQFHLFFSAFIDDQGRIGAFATLPNGDSHAVLLIPCDEDHADAQGCEDLVDSAAATTAESEPVAQDQAAADQAAVGIRVKNNRVPRRSARLMPPWKAPTMQ